jgi:adenosylmethionine-8-amino-7-oxononanoate aminotransferase
MSTSDWVDRDLRSVWHPFTQHSRWPDDPLVIESADGMHLVDDQGRRYLDGVSSLWVTVHGHREPAIDAAIRAQLDRLDHSTFLGLSHRPGVELAEELLSVAPAGLSRVFYAGDGASAVEAAIKMAFQAADQRGEVRPLFVHVAEGYHGDTLGAVSVGGIATATASAPWSSSRWCRRPVACSPTTRSSFAAYDGSATGTARPWWPTRSPPASAQPVGGGRWTTPASARTC